MRYFIAAIIFLFTELLYANDLEQDTNKIQALWCFGLDLGSRYNTYPNQGFGGFNLGFMVDNENYDNKKYNYGQTIRLNFTFLLHDVKSKDQNFSAGYIGLGYEFNFNPFNVETFVFPFLRSDFIFMYFPISYPKKNYDPDNKKNIYSSEDTASYSYGIGIRPYIGLVINLKNILFHIGCDYPIYNFGTYYPNKPGNYFKATNLGLFIDSSLLFK